MKIRFNVTGTNRKALVKAVSEITGADFRYLGAPSFAYEVDYFTVDREGTLIFDNRADTEEIERLIKGLAERGFVAENAEEAATSKETEAGEQESALADIEAAEPNMERDSADVNETEANTKDAPEPITPTLDDGIGLTVSFPIEDFDSNAIQNLRDIVASKAGLIKKSLGIDDLPIEETGDRVSFPWFAVMPDKAESKAYMDFISAICRAAKAQKRVTAKEREIVNEKYTFRCFLLRLGFIGDEYKETRRILLRNLSGNGAFLSGRRKDADDAISI